MALVTHEQTGQTHTPRLVLAPWSAETAAPHVVHVLLNGGTDFTLHEHQPRTGRLRFFFLTEGEALSCAASNRALGTLTLTGGEIPGGSLRYITGSVSESQDERLETRWVVEVTFQEVPA